MKYLVFIILIALCFMFPPNTFLVLLYMGAIYENGL